MQDSFPIEEYRKYEHQRSLLERDEYCIDYVEDNNEKIIGFISYWKLDRFIFVEHLAIDKRERSKGIGTSLVNRVLNLKQQPVILEVEPNNSDLCAKRINFYQKLGFCLNSYDYEQPSLRKNSKEIPLCIMSYPYQLSEEDFERIKNEIYSNVYKKTTTADIV